MYTRPLYTDPLKRLVDRSLAFTRSSQTLFSDPLLRQLLFPDSGLCWRLDVIVCLSAPLVIGIDLHFLGDYFLSSDWILESSWRSCEPLVLLSAASFPLRRFRFVYSVASFRLSHSRYMQQQSEAVVGIKQRQVLTSLVTFLMSVFKKEFLIRNSIRKAAILLLPGRSC